MSEYILSADAESLQKLRDELITQLRTISEDIRELVTLHGESGDFVIQSELAEQERALSQELSKYSEIIDNCELYLGEPDNDEISIGSHIVLQSGGDFEEYIITGIWHDQSNYQTYSVIHSDSELGRECIGKKLGEEFSVAGDDGKQYLVIETKPYNPFMMDLDESIRGSVSE